MNMKQVYICSPYRGDIRKNTELAQKAGRYAAMCGRVPVIPHLVFPQFLDDHDPEERVLGLNLAVEQLKSCDELWLIGSTISKGMRFEIETAKEYRIPIRCYDVYLHRIAPRTLAVDDRVDDEYRRTLYGANLL